jgi:cysteine synthase A
MMRRAAEIAAQTGAFATDQFNNADMIEGYRRLGEELLGQLPGPVAGSPLRASPPIGAFCSYVGTAGCFLGVSRALAAALPGPGNGLSSHSLPQHRTILHECPSHVAGTA